MHTLHLFFIFYLTCLMPSTALYGASLLPQERRHSTAENSARINQYLIAAIGRNDLNKIGRFLQLSVNLNVEDKDGATPLKAAIEAKSLQIVELLLRSGARANLAALKFARRLRDAANPDEFGQISLERIVNKLHDARFGQTTSVPLRQIPQPRQTQQPHIGTRAEGFDTEIQSCIRSPRHTSSDFQSLSADQQGCIRAIKRLAESGDFSTVSPLLLSGPPGTGKTYFAEGIAAEIKSMQASEGDIFTFFHIKASALNAGYAGDGVLRIGALIRYCKAHPNALIFIDELDTLFNRDSAKKDGSSAAKNMSQTTAEVWQLLDILEQYPSILVMAATNYEDDIDTALVDRFSETLSFERISSPETIHNLVEHYVRRRSGFDKANVPSLLPFGWFLWKPFLCVYPLSHREIKKFAQNARLESLKSDEKEDTIQSQHWSTARSRLMRRKMLGLTRYCTKENFTLLLGAIGIVSALYQSYRSYQQSLISERALELQEAALTIQRDAAQMQHQGLQMQKDGLATQQLAANMQAQGLALQQDALNRQNEALALQKKSVNAQKNANDMQADAIQFQKQQAGYALFLDAAKYLISWL